MSKDRTPHLTARYRAGDRVSRKNSKEHGTVVHSDSDTKVKWDGGRTSYFKSDKPATVKHREK